MSGSEDANVLRETDKLLKKQKDFLPALALEAYLYLFLGRTDDAERQFEKVLAQSPTNRTALFYVAELSFTRDDFPKASNYYSRLLDLEQGRLDLEMKRQKALLLATDNYLRRATIAEADSRLNEAEDLLRQAIKIAPKEPVLYGQLGALLLKEKNWEAALAAFQHQGDLGAAGEDVQRHKADALMGLGRKDDADRLISSLRTPDARPSIAKDDLEQRAAELEDLGRWGGDIEQLRKIKSADALTRE